MAEPVEVAFYLPEANDAPKGAGVEFLWTDPLGGNAYRILSLPSFVEGIAVNDVIRAATPGPELAFEEVTERSGHSTLRIAPQNPDEDPEGFMETLKDLGCVYHLTTSGEADYSVDVPVSCDPTAVVAVINRAKEGGLADWHWRFLSENHRQVLGVS